MTTQILLTRWRWRSPLLHAGSAPSSDEPFGLYVVDSEGPPLVHVTRTRRCEIVVFGRQQKLLTPLVLGTGSISLNAADNDEKIEISKIVPSQFGDADTKITSTLELPEVLRRLANWAPPIPDVVTVLETANRQKNLAGQLVVDAVPSTNNTYLEAVLGKDLNGKRDDAVKRTSGESSRSPRLRFFGLFGDEPPAPSAKNRSTTSRGSTPSSDASMDMPPLPAIRLLPPPPLPSPRPRAATSPKKAIPQ